MDNFFKYLQKGRFYETLRNTAKNRELEQSCSGIRYNVDAKRLKKH